MDFKISVIPEEPEVVAEREGVHKRIQVELYQETKEAEAMEEGRLENLLQ